MRVRAPLFASLFFAFTAPLFAFVPAVSVRAVELNGEFIYQSAPFPSCHASTLAENNQGVLVAAWFGGTHEKHPDVGIWVAHRHDDGWTTPVQVADGVQADGTRHPCWNPVLFQQPDGPLMLFYKVGPSPRSWWGMLISSTNGGQTWMMPQRLPDGILGPIKNKPVLLSDGRLLCPTSSEHDGWRVHFEMTPDGGKSWKSTGPIHDGREIDAIQPSILFHGSKQLQAVGRTKQGKVFSVWSSDGGTHWGEMQLTNLPNPNSGTDAVTLQDGRHVLVYNHTSKGRSPLNIAISEDGKQWHAAAVLENEPGEYSYPAVIQGRDGMLHVSYTWKRQRIKHVVVDPAQLRGTPMENGTWPE